MQILEYEIDYQLDFDPKTLESCGVSPASINGAEISAPVMYQGGDRILVGCNDINGQLAKLLIDVSLVVSNVSDSDKDFILVCGVAPVHGLSEGYGIRDRLMNNKTVFSFDYLEVIGDAEKNYTWGYDAWSYQAEIGVTYPSEDAARVAAVEYFLKDSDFVVPKEISESFKEKGSIVALDPMQL